MSFTLFTLSWAFAITLIALLHAAWGVKIWWPIKDEKALARAVVGARDIEEMPGAFACLSVAAALFVGVAAAFLSLPTEAHEPVRAAAGRLTVWAFSLVFIFRGLIGFTAFWARLAPEEPFRRLNRTYYSPLCLLLGLGGCVIAFGG
ncbi:MAG: DUF3995 domain-containing protein [Pseudomonadota bacterium]